MPNYFFWFAPEGTYTDEQYAKAARSERWLQCRAAPYGRRKTDNAVVGVLRLPKGQDKRAELVKQQYFHEHRLYEVVVTEDLEGDPNWQKPAGTKSPPFAAVEYIKRYTTPLVEKVADDGQEQVVELDDEEEQQTGTRARRRSALPRLVRRVATR